jgi:hypothetical protein
MDAVEQPRSTTLNRQQRRAKAAAERHQREPDYGPVKRGVSEIADYLGEDERRTQYLLGRGLVPGAFQIGNRWHLRPATHQQKLAELENANTS